MATIHFLCGYMGFGKTTIARKLSVLYNAVILNDDELMVHLFGRNLPEEEFRLADKKIKELTWLLTERIISAGGNVILDRGFWSKQSRAEAVERTRIFCSQVQFHQIECDMETAKQRVLQRNKLDEKSLEIEESTFDSLSQYYEPISPEEGLSVIYYNNTLNNVSV